MSCPVTGCGSRQRVATHAPANEIHRRNLPCAVSTAWRRDRIAFDEKGWNIDHDVPRLLAADNGV